VASGAAGAGRGDGARATGGVASSPCEESEAGFRPCPWPFAQAAFFGGVSGASLRHFAQQAFRAGAVSGACAAAGPQQVQPLSVQEMQHQPGPADWKPAAPSARSSAKVRISIHYYVRIRGRASGFVFSGDPMRAARGLPFAMLLAGACSRLDSAPGEESRLLERLRTLRAGQSRGEVLRILPPCVDSADDGRRGEIAESGGYALCYPVARAWGVELHFSCAPGARPTDADPLAPGTAILRRLDHYPPEHTVAIRPPG